MFVSGLVHGAGPPGRILDAARRGVFRLVTSEAINAEIIAVLERPRLSERYGFAKFLPEIIQLITLRADLVADPPAVRRSSDPDDDKFLAAATHGRVPYLVTGDSAGLLSLKRFRRVRIVPPARFLALLERRESARESRHSE